MLCDIIHRSLDLGDGLYLLSRSLVDPRARDCIQSISGVLSSGHTFSVADGRAMHYKHFLRYVGHFA